MIKGVEVLRYSAFTDVASGGNRAGVVLDATGLDEAAMLGIAADLGYSETAFLWRLPAPNHFRVRYFSPVAEVPFCGHATIASAIALADAGARGTIRFTTQSGEVVVDISSGARGAAVATLTSVVPSVGEVAAATVDEALAGLRWQAGDLDPALPPRTAFAGAHHLIVGVASRERLASLDYDVPALSALMSREGWTTVELVWRETPATFHARVPFPAGSIVEDPATGAGAAAFGAYLRELGLVTPPAVVTMRQGEDMGRPSLLTVSIAASGGIQVSGGAVRL